jgi:hypothetical protein
MYRFKRYYISPNIELALTLMNFGDSQLARDLVKPVCFGCGEGGFPGISRSAAELRAKMQFLVWLFQVYGSEDDDRQFCTAIISDFTFSETTFDRYFKLAHGTQVGRKLAVNAEVFIRKQLRLDVVKAITLPETSERAIIEDIIDFKLSQQAHSNG